MVDQYHYDAHVIGYYLQRPHTMMTEWLAKLASTGWTKHVMYDDRAPFLFTHRPTPPLDK